MAYGNSSRGGRSASGRPQNSRGGRPGVGRPGQGGKPGAKGAGARGGRPGAPKNGAGKGGAKGFGEKKFGEKKFGAGRAGRGRGTELPKRERRAPGRPYRSGEAFAHERGEYRVSNYAGPHRPRRPRNAPVDHYEFYDHDGVRLQKLMAQAGVASRRVCEEMITEGRVTVNGEVVTELGVRVDPSKVTVQVDGGITEETILRAAEAGATCFVAGSSVYGVDEALGGPEAAIASLRAAAASVKRAGSGCGCGH